MTSFSNSADFVLVLCSKCSIDLLRNLTLIMFSSFQAIDLDHWCLGLLFATESNVNHYPSRVKVSKIYIFIYNFNWCSK